MFYCFVLEIEITEESEVCRKREDVILGDHALTFKFETEEQAKSFRKFIDFRLELFPFLRVETTPKKSMKP